MLIPYLAITLLIVATAYSAIVSFRENPAEAKPAWLFPERTSRLGRISVGVVSLVLIVTAAGWIGIGMRSISRRSSRFLIPEGYTGWVRVEFDVQGEPALLSEDGQYLLRIPPNGLLKTSSPEQFGWAKDAYYFYSGAGLHSLHDSGSDQLISGKINGEAMGPPGKRKYEEFFVGTNQQFKQQLQATGAGKP